jgi:hypothetical protein
MSETYMVGGICPRCGRAVGTGHTQPECDAYYAETYARSLGGLIVKPDEATVDLIARALYDHAGFGVPYAINRIKSPWEEKARAVLAALGDGI